MFFSQFFSEQLWSVVSKIKKEKTNDQRRLNGALKKLNLEWVLVDNQTWVGQNSGGFTVSLLKFSSMCRRHECMVDDMPHVYVWHHGDHDGDHDSEGKKENSKLDGTWFLRDDWMKIVQSSSAVGVKWLQEMTRKTIFVFSSD